MAYIDKDYYSIPHVCEKCGGTMIFEGVGEYRCEKCGFTAFDNYGKVRCYIEEHRGATAAEIEEHTGVPQRAIRQMLRESRLEVTETSKVFMRCEGCNKPIRSGRFCPECEKQYHSIDAEQKEKMNKLMKGFATELLQEEKGEKRFRRKEF